MASSERGRLLIRARTGWKRRRRPLVAVEISGRKIHRADGQDFDGVLNDAH